MDDLKDETSTDGCYPVVFRVVMVMVSPTQCREVMVHVHYLAHLALTNRSLRLGCLRKITLGGSLKIW